MKTFRCALLLWMGLAATTAAGQDADSNRKLKVDFDNTSLSTVLEHLHNHVTQCHTLLGRI